MMRDTYSQVTVFHILKGEFNLSLSYTEVSIVQETRSPSGSPAGVESAYPHHDVINVDDVRPMQDGCLRLQESRGMSVQKLVEFIQSVKIMGLIWEGVDNSVDILILRAIFLHATVQVVVDLISVDVMITWG